MSRIHRYTRVLLAGLILCLAWISLQSVRGQMIGRGSISASAKAFPHSEAATGRTNVTAARAISLESLTTGAVGVFGLGASADPAALQAGCATPTFTNAVGSPISVGNNTNPHYIGVGYFNADNHLDIVTTNFDAGTVTILLGNGMGGFTITPGSPIAVGGQPVTAEVGDFNNDTKADIAVSNQSTHNLTILLGNGDGTFAQAAGSPIAVGMFPRAVAKGYFNADGNQDLVVSNGGTDDLTILLGNGDGTFTPAAGSPVAAGDAAFQTVVGNFNGDANADLAVANFGEGSVRIFLGNGNGGFTQSGGPIFVGTFTSYIAMGNFNADANVDLAVTNRVSNNVVVLLGNGSGGFAPAAGSPYSVGTSPMAVAVGDLNLDGNLDLAVSNEGSATTSILLGNGSGGFSTPYFVNKGQLPTHVAIADFNEDNKPDLATSDGGDDTLTILLNACSACQVITVNPATLSAATIGSAFSQTFSASGGTAPYSFSLTGALPAGMSFAGATLSGTPAETGSFPITVMVSDNFGCLGSRNYTLVVNCQTIAVSPATIPSGTVNVAYTQTFAQTGGMGAVGFSLTGTLPTGLTFAGATLSGTPTQAGSFPITVTATDANNCTGSTNYTLVINCQTITVDQTSIPAGTAGTAYSQTFTQTGGLGTTTFSVTGALPTGLSFVSPTLSGTPTQTGSFPITIKATDANGCLGMRNYTLVINCQAISVNPATIPAATAGTAYSQTFTQTGAIGTTTFSLTGTLPAGLTFAGATLSGTPTQTGSFPITVKATDANGCTGMRDYTLMVNCSTIAVSPATIPAGTAGTAYSQTFTQTGGIGTVGFALTGTLPAGLSFTSPTLSGTPTQTGSFPITVMATDANGCVGSTNYTLVINCQTITVHPATISTGVVGAAYSQSFTQTGGIGTTGFSLTGTLPTGLSFAGATLSGTPTQPGSFPITVRATDANGCMGTHNYTLVIDCQTITVNPATIPAATAGSAYSQTFTQTDGTGTTGFSLTGTLPSGLTFAGATLSGTPTQTGSFPITIKATDENGCMGTRSYTLVVNCASITVNPAAIPAGTAGSAYSQTFTQTGGLGAITFGLTGKLPAGITLTGGTLSGTPAQVGSYPITVTATDANGCTGSRNYTLVINCQTITVNPATIQAGMVGAAYSQSFTQTGGIGTTSFNLTGTLPAGISFAGATLSGTPTQAGSFPITVKATDANGCIGTHDYTLVINCQAIAINPATIPAGMVGAVYSQLFAQTGGTGTTTFSLTGTLPTGLTFTGATLSGTPTQNGSFPITIKATDANGCTGMRDYTLIINCQAIAVTPATIASGTVGTAYNQTFSQTGGVGAITLSLTGKLPAGLTFAGETLSGTPAQTGSYPITITATDANNCTGSRGYTLVITCQTITVNPATILAGTAGTAYSQTFAQSGGVGATTLSLTGMLPAGLTFSGATLSGTPTQTGNFPITVKATDANGCIGMRDYTLVINCQTITINPATIPAAGVGSAYSQVFTHTGGIGVVTVALTGALPAGMSFAGATLSGTPTQSGSFPITITATDANGCTGARGYTLSVGCPGITVGPATVPAGTAGTAYGQTFTQTGGVGAVTFSVVGTLPAGLTLAGATLSGTPTQTGSFPITIKATDANGCAGMRDYTLIINCQAIAVTPATIPAGAVGAAYSQTFAQTGGIGATAFNLSGKLPAGLTFSGATLSGTPAQTGSYPITVTATDANNCTGSRGYTLVISCQSISVGPAAIPAGTVGITYSQVFTQTGGTGATTFSVTGALPTGLSFAGGTLSGTPTQTGNFPITVTATDANGCTGSRGYTLVINCQIISVTPATIPQGTVGAAYSQAFAQNGGTGTTTFALLGKLPAGMSFAGATLSGASTQSGSYPITITATDANGCTGSRNYTLVINCQTITVNPATLATGSTGAPYSQTFTHTGGIGTVSFALTGTLPAGLSFAGGTLSGTPTQSGSFPIAITATDANNCTGSRNYTLAINCPGIIVNPATIPAGLTGAPYSQTFTQTGGGGAITFSISAGILPQGMNLSSAGVLSGTPSNFGVFAFVVRATAANGCFGERQYNLRVCPVITLGPATLPAGTVNAAYDQIITVTGGGSPYGFAISAGSLPTGLSLDPQSGALNGTPNHAGSYTFTVQATDANGCAGVREYTVVINCQTITVNPPALADGFMGTAYAQTLTAGGGIAPNTFAISGGTLPGGLTLSAGGVLSGTPTTAGSFTFTVMVTDAGNCTGSRQYTIIVSSGGLVFYPLAHPVRLLDTRAGATACFTPNAAITGGTSRTQSGRGACDGLTIPADAAAITGNITTVQSGGGFLTLYPSYASQPLAANSNYGPNEIVNNVFTVGLGAGDGAFKIFVQNTTDVVVDVTGYYAPPGTGGLYFHKLPKPIRMLDSRTGATACFTPGAPFAAGTETPQQARITCDGVTIPSAALAVVGNATTVAPAGSGFLTLFPADATRPLVASSNYNANQIVNGPFTVGLASTGEFKIYTSATTNLVVDVLGYYSTEASDANGAGMLFNSLTKPVRLLDTRAGATACFAPNAPITGNTIFTQAARGACNGETIPVSALAVVGNATVVNSNGGFLTLWPSDAAQPLVATSNFTVGQVFNRHFIVGLGADGAFKIYSQFTTDLVIDVSGYFAP